MLSAMMQFDLSFLLRDSEAAAIVDWNSQPEMNFLVSKKRQIPPRRCIAPSSNDEMLGSRLLYLL